MSRPDPLAPAQVIRGVRHVGFWLAPARGTMAGMSDATPAAEVTESRPRRFRKLRIAASVFFGAMTVALCVLWVRSYWQADQYHVRFWDRREALAASKSGRMIFISHRSLHRTAWRFLHISYPVDDELSFPVGPIEDLQSIAGFGIISQPKFNVIRSNPSVRYYAPFYFGPQNAQIGMAIQVPTQLYGDGIMVPFWCLALVNVSLVLATAISSTAARFSLRTLLIVTTLVAVVLGLGMWAAR